METWWDGQRLRADGERDREREREIKRIKALKIQTVRWRQTQTVVTEKERQLLPFPESLKRNFMQSGRDLLVLTWWMQNHTPSYLYGMLLFGKV